MTVEDVECDDTDAWEVEGSEGAMPPLLPQVTPPNHSVLPSPHTLYDRLCGHCDYSLIHWPEWKTVDVHVLHNGRIRFHATHEVQGAQQCR